MIDTARLAAPLALLLLSAACASAPRQPEPWRASDQGATFAEAWLTKPEAEARDRQIDGAPYDRALLQAEADYWWGDYDRALTIALALLERDPSHPLAALAAARVSSLRGLAPRWDERVAPIIEPIRYGQVHPTTAAYLSWIGQRITRIRWSIDQEPEPFRADALGLPLAWRATPRLSSYPAHHFDLSFAPESDAELAAHYRAPSYAEQDPFNQVETFPFVSSDIDLAPRLGGAGIYYLETWASVAPEAAGVYYLYANFPGGAELLVDGRRALVRRESDGYGPGKMMRRVKLSAGTHRLLLKMAYRPDERDWFDLTLLAKRGGPLGKSGVTFSPERPEGAAAGAIELLSDQSSTSALQRWTIEPDQAAQAELGALYFAALAAYLERDADRFAPLWLELSRRAPEAAPVWGLAAAQLETRWDLPSSIRNARSGQMLRRALALAPHSPRFALAVYDLVRSGGEKAEARRLAERARDEALDEEGRLRSALYLTRWADYLEEEGLSVEAEAAWRRALAVEPDHCGAARRLDGLLSDRGVWTEPSELVARAERCPSLARAFRARRIDDDEDRLERAALRAARYPYSSSSQIEYARLLRAAGQTERADEVLARAQQRAPRSRRLLEERVELAMARRGPEAALAELDEHAERYGQTAWTHWRRAAITGVIPLRDLVADGPQVARRVAESGAASEGAGDEAFYAIDFAAQRYFPDGSALSLTHTLVRVMTKNAIDRYGEVQLPSGARVLRARTIKADGSTRVPDQVANKETLSMPGLAPGDFIELAYLEYVAPPADSNTQRAGTRFFFQMRDISSLRSEYVIIRPPADLLREHGAPEPEAFTYDGAPAVRFVRRDSPRPRTEPYTPSIDEYLPWVQGLQVGTTVSPAELDRLRWREMILTATKPSRLANEQVDAWLSALPPDAPPMQKARALFYTVTEFFAGSTRASTQNVTHAIAAREGNAFLVLLYALERAGIEADLWLASTPQTMEREHPLLTMNHFTTMALRVRAGDRTAWARPTSADAMFDALPIEVLGQEAICVSCEQAKKTTIPRPETTKVRAPRRAVSIQSALDEDGTLRGTIRQRYEGTHAVRAREILRARREQAQRAKFVGSLVAEHFSGARLTDYAIERADEPDAPLTLVLEFERPNFARPQGDALILEAAPFRQGYASAYATLPDRQTPLFVGSATLEESEMTMTLPGEATLRGRSGAASLDSPFGQVERSITLDDRTLRVRARAAILPQRVAPARYNAFQSWALAVEQSAALSVVITP